MSLWCYFQTTPSKLVSAASFDQLISNKRNVLQFGNGNGVFWPESDIFGIFTYTCARAIVSAVRYTKSHTLQSLKWYISVANPLSQNQLSKWPLCTSNFHNKFHISSVTLWCDYVSVTNRISEMKHADCVSMCQWQKKASKFCRTIENVWMRLNATHFWHTTIILIRSSKRACLCIHLKWQALMRLKCMSQWNHR